MRAAIPAVEAYNADNSKGYSGLDLTDMKSYDQGVKNVVILGTSNTVSYCLRSSVGTKSWYKQGPGGDITTTAVARTPPQLNSKRARETAPSSLFQGQAPAADSPKVAAVDVVARRVGLPRGRCLLRSRPSPCSWGSSG